MPSLPGNGLKMSEFFKIWAVILFTVFILPVMGFAFVRSLEWLAVNADPVITISVFIISFSGIMAGVVVWKNRG